MTVGRRTYSVLVWLAASLAFAACASSKKQTESSQQSSEKTSEKTSEGASGDRERLEVQKRVHFEDILGTKLERDRPPGCIGSWDVLDNSPYSGDAYFCTKFNGPKKWGDIPVTMVVDDGRLAVIAVQIFFEGSTGARGEYNDFTGNLLDRCDRRTGFERNIVLDCGDYFIDASWQPGHAQAQMRVVYATSLELLKKK